MKQILFIVIAILLFGCDNTKTLSPYKWRSLGGEIDTLTVRLEWQFNNYSPFDSIYASVEGMKRAADMDSSCVQKMARYRYWLSRYYSRIGKKDSTLMMIKKALEINDSLNYTYDHLRMKFILYNEELTNGALLYRHYEKCLEYAKKNKDIAFEAYTSINMGNLLNNVGEYERGLDYLNLADSLNRKVGFEKLAVKNAINRASSIKHINADSAINLLKPLINHPIIEEDKDAKDLILRNIFFIGGDVAYLNEAYNLVEMDSNRRDLIGLYSSLFVNHYFQQENYDSALYYDSIALRNLPYVTDYDQKAVIYFNHSLALLAKDSIEASYKARVEYEDNFALAQINRNSVDVMRLNVLHEIADIERQYKIESYKKKILILIILIALLVAFGVVFFYFQRRHAKQKMKSMEVELSLEKARLQMAANALILEEKDKILNALKEDIASIRGDGFINENSARRLETTIKVHLAEHEAEDSFREMFDVINPDFSKNLREKCPGIADSYIKIASYILMGMDVKKIASLMMIKPESVHQARWRLRRKLNLVENETLEDALRNLNGTR